MSKDEIRTTILGKGSHAGCRGPGARDTIVPLPREELWLEKYDFVKLKETAEDLNPWALLRKRESLLFLPYLAICSSGLRKLYRLEHIYEKEKDD